MHRPGSEIQTLYIVSTYQSFATKRTDTERYLFFLFFGGTGFEEANPTAGGVKR